MRSLMLSMLAALVPLTFESALAAPEDVTVGATRAVYAREGATLRVQPTVLARRGELLPYATTMTVAETRTVGPVHWIRVTAANGRSGWLRANETVHPQAMSAVETPGAPIATRVGAGYGRDVTSAAGRQLLDQTEQDYKAQRTDLATAYALLDQLEQAKVPERVNAEFQARGRLGRKPTEATR